MLHDKNGSEGCGFESQTRVMLSFAFSSRARILGECSTIHSQPARFFCLFFLVVVFVCVCVCVFWLLLLFVFFAFPF